MADRAQVKAPAAARGGAAAAAIAAVALIITPFTAAHEGELLTPKRDMGGVLTACYGETRHVEMRRYSHAECVAKLQLAIRKDFAPGVLACVPTFAPMTSDNRYAFAGATDAAYNAGIGALCHSTAAAAWRRRDWQGGCRLLIGWRATVHHEPVRGLANRRHDEDALCSQGLS